MGEILPNSVKLLNLLPLFGGKERNIKFYSTQFESAGEKRQLTDALRRNLPVLRTKGEQVMMHN